MELGVNKKHNMNIFYALYFIIYKYYFKYLIIRIVIIYYCLFSASHTDEKYFCSIYLKVFHCNNSVSLSFKFKIVDSVVK